ncbi:Nucleosome assembly protein 1-like [Trichinella spiralis]|uniref:Nucleosome assembly protein 1-like n=1 Tax=Trichinella spiralis TaxID=6334 RepID=A0ABR3KNX5_TRISP
MQTYLQIITPSAEVLFISACFRVKFVDCVQCLKIQWLILIPKILLNIIAAVCSEASERFETALQAPLREKRRQIITGEYEPDEAETELVENDEFLRSFNVVRETILKKSPELREMVTADVKGVPDFWATVLRNGEFTGELVNPNDEILLKSLTNIEVRYSKDPEGFSLHFFFDENDYFTNTELTKHYVTTTEMRKRNPFDYDAKERQDWKLLCSEGDYSDEEQKDYLLEDIEVAEVIRDQLVPNAVLFFTGEAADQDDFDDEETADFDKSETETDEEY